MRCTFSRIAAAALCFFLVASISGCGKNNIFSWAHKPGSVATTESLASDGYTALSNKDYVKAMEYFAKILQAEPNNSEAIYYYSVASLANSGIDIASLVSNMITESAAAPSRLAPAISSLVFAAPSSNLLPDTIINNRVKINTAINEVLASGLLPKIVKGLADGKIKPDSADVNVNVAFCLVLRAALRLNDLVDFSSDYKATIKPGVSQAALEDTARASLKDIASAYQRVKLIAAKFNKRTTLSDLNDDISKLFNDLKTDLGNQTPPIDASDISINGDYL